MMPRYARIIAASCRIVLISSRRAGAAARRKRMSSPMSRAASGAPFSASCCALPSVLNRKCGSICSCRSFNFDSASWRDVSLCRASASRCAVIARYSRLRRCAISAVTSANSTPNTSPAVTTWRSLALSWKKTNGSTPLTNPAMLAPTSAPKRARIGAATM